MRSVTLNACEQKMAEYVAKSRYENARSRGIVDQKMGDQGNWETDLEGIGGEIAFCKLHNVYPDLETFNTDLPDHDCLVNGFKVDVKTTHYPEGKLLATLAKAGAIVDVYVLMVGEFPTYEYKGLAKKSDLIRDENIYDLGHGPGYVLNQIQLVRS